ncbi:unnamed protein product [Symbiodinium natans]|uniref:PPPDE domain-containing protein n=1 Tax=Symbiodinium natans TaxID=878477 RepID=A0A812TUG2_9DINO|nr:unnamed protein product [Symbiodinium natans]
MECFRWLWATPEVCCPFGTAFSRILAEVEASEDAPSNEDGASVQEEVSSMAEEVEEDVSMTSLQDLPITLLAEIRQLVTDCEGVSDLGKASSAMMEAEAPINTEEDIPVEKVVRSVPYRFSSTRRETPITRVTLNVYDVAADARWVNGMFANHLSPFKLGGAFHVGLQVGNEEWAFGYTQRGTGVYRTVPRSWPHFRESVELTPIQLPEDKIAEIYRLLARDWTGSEYHLLQRNCCDFASEASLLLGAGDLPKWTFRFADWGCAAAQAIGLIETSAMTSGI